VSDRLRQLAGRWVNVCELSDDQLSRAIKEDAVDILVDLAGHTAGNRLLVFAAGAAPIQMTYLGYPNTTGIPPELMRYRITDAQADPAGPADSMDTEELLRLPHTFLCYRSPAECPDPAPPPFAKNGFITFGSFNNLAKVNSFVMHLWSHMLQAIPRSRIMLKAKSFADVQVRDRIIREFAARGIVADRIALVRPDPAYVDHLRHYGDIDIALDPHPYNGTTTTCEAMWMGVPVITLTGDVHRSRVGVSLLSNVGLAEFIAATPDEYVRVAERLSANPSRLSQLRAELRQIMRGSALMQALPFTRALEAAYRFAWQRWLSEQTHQ